MTTCRSARKSSRKSRSARSSSQGDDQWFNIVKWTHFAMVNAEELGVTSANAEEMKNSDNPSIKRLLGTEGAFGSSNLGISNDWAFNIDLAGGQLRRSVRAPTSARTRRCSSLAARQRPLDERRPAVRSADPLSESGSATVGSLSLISVVCWGGASRAVRHIVDENLCRPARIGAAFFVVPPTRCS